MSKPQTAADYFALVQVGTKLKNNDPRATQPIVTVTEIQDVHTGRPPYAIYQAGTRRASIRFDRIYVDGKPRAKGYDYISPEKATAAA